ncbi:MAG: FxLYD domain-containing protein [Chloroflexia bacterium]
MPYEPALYNSVPKRRDERSTVLVVLGVILAICLVCTMIGGIVGFFAVRSVGEVYPTIQAGIAATLTATAAPPGAAYVRPTSAPVPDNLTPRPTNTLAPTMTPRPTQTPTPVRPTSTPLPKPEVQLQQIGYYRDVFGELWFMGELLNSSALDAGDFRISVALIGATGQVVASAAIDTTEIGVVALKPGQKTVWQVKIPQAPRQWQTERIEATTGPVIVARGQSPYLELKSDGVQLSGPTKPFNRVTANGQLVNIGLATVRDARVQLALYDDAGKLIRVIEGWPKFEAVPAGGTVAFSVDFSDLDQPPTHYALYFTDLR